MTDAGVRSTKQPVSTEQGRKTKNEKLRSPTMKRKPLELYVHIPFCKKKCNYCDFLSAPASKPRRQEYMQALMTEIMIWSGAAYDNHEVKSIFIGGGTPSTLSTPQIIRLLDTLRESFDFSRCIEFTVEGGRPDTLDAEKLRAIREHGADRMSINPQTMEDPVLRACGRPHKAQDVIRAYHEAEDAGFTAINMDLIAGLPQDSVEGFIRSLDTVAALNPANITVHTLALKKGADLFEKREGLSTAEEVTRMVDYANETLRAHNFKPYYLYRQKYMSGSFENVGWSRDNLDCLYNIYMMEELHTIVSLGGGGMNKVNLPDGTLRRFHNPKFPEQYIEMIDSVKQQKEELFALL